MPRKLQVGLFGFGTVGESLYHLLNGSPDAPAEIRHICVKNQDKARSLPTSSFTYHHDDVLEDDSLDLIVEAIDNADEAFEISRQALRRGFNVVTANKKMVAYHLKELFALQRETGHHMLYDAAVCGSIPILRNVEEYYALDNPHMISGILNGSCNYILTQLTRDPGKTSYDTVLQQAQDKGFAESDPSLDVAGYDALYKLIILAAHSYGVVARPEHVLRYGIQTVNSVDLAFAQARGKRLKLIGQAQRVENQLGLMVLPKMVNAGDRLFYVEDEFNGVSVEAVAAGTHFYYGKGAGGNPTAYAMLSDIFAFQKAYHYGLNKVHNKLPLKASESLPVRIYLRLPQDYQITLPVFEGEVEAHSMGDFTIMVGTTMLRELHGFVQTLDENNKNIMLAILEED